jgi:hypothetical protein
MNLTRRLATLGVSVALTAGLSAVQPARSFPELQKHLGAERFQLVSSIRGLPLGVRNELERMFSTGGLDIADPGAAFQGSGAPAGTTRLPLRRLIAAGCSRDSHCIVYYERSGKPITHRVALFQWSPAVTRMEWGGAAPAGLATVEGVRKAIVSGAIKGGDGSPW